MMKLIKISVSVLSKNDDETIRKLNEVEFDYFHIDVMDGKFVKEINFPLSRIEQINKIANKPLDVHLMVDDIDFYIDNLSSFNIEYLTIHYEVFNGNIELLKKIKKKGIKCGLSVKPITDIKETFNLLDNIDLILIMSVEPGYGGQEFMPSSLEKIRILKGEIKRRNLKTIISVDGGINKENAKLCLDSGADMLVTGSYVVMSENYQVAIDSLKFNN